MSATIPLSRSLGLAQSFVRQAPLTFAGVTNEPGFSLADWVRQFMLNPPFAWPWNRAETTVNCVVGTQDYKVSLPTFGWLEKGVLQFTDTGTQSHELTVKVCLAEESVENEPTFVAAQSDDGAGNITFRLMPPPDRAYTLKLIYQQAAPLFGSSADTWAPIPDRLRHLYDTGLLAKTYEYLDDSRFGITMQLFLRQVIAANAALEESEVNLFLDPLLTSQRESQAKLGNDQMGRQGRGMF